MRDVEIMLAKRDMEIMLATRDIWKLYSNYGSYAW